MMMVSTGMVIISVVTAVDFIVVVAVVVVIVIVTPAVTVTVDVIVYLHFKHVLSARSFEKYPIYQYFIH